MIGNVPRYTTEWHLHGYLGPSLALTRVAWPCEKLVS